jgi:hypothetical protein
MCDWSSDVCSSDLQNSGASDDLGDPPRQQSAYSGIEDAAREGKNQQEQENDFHVNPS